MAKEIEKILKEKTNKKIVLADLTTEDWAEAVEDAFRYSHIILAASSYNLNVFPPMEHLLRHLKDRNYQHRTVGIIENGSWAPSAAKSMNAILEEMKDINIIEPVVTIKSTLKDADVEKLNELADKMIENMS